MNDRSFLGRMKTFGRWRLIKSKDFIATILIFLVLSLVDRNIILSMNKEFLQISWQFSTALLSVILAGFAIIIAFTDKDFIKFMKEAKAFDNILFLFEWNIYVTILVVILGVLISSFNSMIILYPVYLFAFIYMFFSILCLISFITFYGIKKGEFTQKK